MGTTKLFTSESVSEGHPDKVKAETRNVLDVMTPGGGFVAGASHDHVVDACGAPEELDAVVQEAADTVELILREGPERAMEKANRRS